MNVLRLINRYTRLKSLDKLDCGIILLNLALFAVSVKSIRAGQAYADKMITYINGYKPDIFDHIRNIMEYHELSFGVAGIFVSLLVIFMVLKK